MKIPVKEILEIPVLMDLFVIKRSDDSKPYRLLFDELIELGLDKQEDEEYEVFFSKVAESKEGNCFLTLFKLKEDKTVKPKILGEYIYSVNGCLIKEHFAGILTDYVNVFAI